jgi:vitamin B12 transporter
MFKTSISALALVLGAFGAPALADDADVILVTTTRVAADAETLPASVTVIDRDQIELEGVITLADLLTTAPGVQSVQSGPAGSLTSVFIRGSNAKHALALYDGIRINDASSANGVFNFGSDTLGDAGRVEIVRGPLSSIYGSDAVGGVINILPRALPQEGYEPSAALELGELDTVRASAGFGYGAEHWRFSASTERMTTDGYDVTPARIVTADGDPDGAQFTTLTLRGEADVAESVQVDALYRWRQSEVEFDTFSGGPSGFQRADEPDVESEDKLEVWALGLTHAADTVETRLRAGQVRTALDSFKGGALIDTYESERAFAEARATLQPGGHLEPVITAGLDWQDESIDTDTAFNAPLSISEDVLSVYLIGQAEAGAATFTASIRHDDYDAFDGQTTANLGAVWRLDALSTRLRASWGTSFKAPTLSERFASSAFVTPNPDLLPEEGESVELGFDTRLDLADRADALRFGAAWYDGEIENLIENVFDFATFTGTNRNIGEADLTGWEAYVTLSPVDALEFQLDYTQTDATDADTGDALLRRPEHALSASASWRASERLTLNTRVTHTGERLDVTYDDAGFFVSAAGEVNSYQLVDLAGQYDITEGVQLFATVRNVFDESYEQPAAFAGAPRTISVGVRWRP